MKVAKCPLCGKKGFLTFRYTKFKDMRYPYIGHYDPKKKTKRRWCHMNSIHRKKLDKKILWQETYYKLIADGDRIREKTEERQNWGKPLIKAARLLENNGYQTDQIEPKLLRDLMIEYQKRLGKRHVPSKKPIERILSKEQVFRLRYDMLKKSLNLG